MTGFFDVISALPTVVFTALSLMSLLYWLLVIVGAADLDALDGIAGHHDGLFEGAVDAVAGVAKGGTSALGEVLSAFGFTKVPLTISTTLFSFFGFFLSVSTRHLLDPIVPGVLSALAACVVAVVGGAAGTSLITRPLRPLFVEPDPKKQGGRSLIGQLCTITIDADDRSGQARTSGEVIVSVRAIGQSLVRGTEVVIMDRSDDGIFIVEPVAAVLPTTADAFARLASVDAAASAATVDATVVVSETKKGSE